MPSSSMLELIAKLHTVNRVQMFQKPLCCIVSGMMTKMRGVHIFRTQAFSPKYFDKLLLESGCGTYRYEGLTV